MSRDEAIGTGDKNVHSVGIVAATRAATRIALAIIAKDMFFAGRLVNAAESAT